MNRLGIGSKATTQRVFDKICAQYIPNEHLSILDIGCGCGAQTFDLAEKVKGTILAIDNYKPFLEGIEAKCKTAKSEACQITTAQMNMSDLKLEENSFDVVWSESSIYSIGFSKGLSYFSKFLKPKGILAVSEVAWSKAGPSKRAKEFWEREYPQMETIEQLLGDVKESQLKLLDYFVMDSQDWFKDYYDPLQHNISALRAKYADTPEALKIFEQTQEEIDLRKSADAQFYEYYFFILHKL